MRIILLKFVYILALVVSILIFLALFIGMVVYEDHEYPKETRLGICKKIIDIETQCSGVQGCNYTYTLEDGSIAIDQSYPVSNHNGYYCYN